MKNENEYLIKNKYLYYLPRKLTHSILYKRYHDGKAINWKNPTTLDEKLHRLIIGYGKKEAFYADKYRVRDYVRECGCGDLLTEIYGCWESADEVDLDALPSRFVLKTNNAFGGKCYVLCKDKTKIDWGKELSRLQSRLGINFGRLMCEYHYTYIKPLLFAEEYLDDGGERMSDYKIFCFGGEPKYVLVCSDRDAGRDIFDLDWNHTDYVKSELCLKNKIPRPKSLDRMIDAARILSKPFPFARVDFYDVNGKAYFGEITLSPAAGNVITLNEKGQHALGELLVLPKRSGHEA